MHAISSAHERPDSLSAAVASRYRVFGQIGAGGMATVHYAEFSGPGGFSRPVAIKRLHPHLARDPSFASLFLDEARLSARIAHANVVATLDVLTSFGARADPRASAPDEIAVVMEYVHGESLASLLSMARARATRIPYKIAVNLLVGVLHGLHAAHELLGEHGEPLGIVHRDVSPENILVGCDGIPRLLDFGIAKAKGRARVTPSGELKGKLGYMAPEQYNSEDIDRRVDIHGASVVLWQVLTGRTLFDGASDAAVVQAVMHKEVPPPSELADGIPPMLDALVLRGLSRERAQRFGSAREMALWLERDVGVATQTEVCDWLSGLAGELLNERAARLAELRKQSQGQNTRHAAQRETRRLEATAAASAPTRAQLAPATVSAESARSGTRVRRPAKLLLALVVLAVVSGGAWLASALQGSAAMPESASSPVRVVPPPPEPVRARNALAAPAPPAPVPLSPAAAELPRAPGEKATAQARRSKPEPEPERASKAPKSVSKSSKRADCRQPYDVDALGIRRWRRECL